ncbi:hypothetical protein CLOM_g3762, partial [Closterium sp. NIES-68]
CYLEGRKTTVYTDHCSLKYLKTQPSLSRRQVRWIDFLETHFHYDIGLLLEEYHDVLYAGHFGSNKTITGIAKHYYWPHMVDDVQKFVTSCDTCQRMKSSKQKKAGLLQPFPVPEQPWRVVSLDFITGVTTYHRAVMTQSLSSSTSSPKWDTSSRHTQRHAPRRQHNSSFVTSSHSMAFQPHSSPTETPSSPASFGRKLCLFSGPNSPCHPHTIRKQMDRPSASTKLWSNSSEQPAKTTSPNGTCICSSWSLPTTMPLTPLLERCRSSSVTDATRSHSTANHTSHTQVTPVTFRLRLPATWKIHNAFHVQLLKPYRDPNTIFAGRQLPPPLSVLVHDEPEYEVESVLAHRRRRNGTVELLIRWKGYDSSKDSWVPETDMDNARRPQHDYLFKQGVTSTTQL